MSQDHIGRTTAVYNTIAQTYAARIEQFAPEQERRLFSKLVKKSGSILDVGSAAGRDSTYFAKQGFKVIGIDLSEELLKIARTKYPQLDFRLQDMRQLKFKPLSFDGIWANASLLHLKRAEVPSVLEQFYTLLKPKGVMFVSVKEGTGEKDVSEPLSENLLRHFTFFRLDELKQLLVNAGFTVENIYTYREGERHAGKRDLTIIASFSRKI